MKKMKDSGVAWIGEIPSNWALVRVKNQYSSHKTIAGSDSEKYERLALTLNGVIKRSKEDSNGLQPEAFDGYQVLNTGELVFKLIDLANVATSRVGYSPYTGIVSPAYIILSPNKDAVAKFGEKFFLSMWQREVFNHMGDDGVRSSLNVSDLLNIPYPHPPLPEQQRIADFLDRKCADIDNILEKIKASIEEYKKLKQSIITEAVTKGVRGTRPMKDSGIEWANSVPSDWEVKRIKWCVDSFSKGNGITKDEVFVDGDMPCIRYGEIYSKYGNSFSECVSATKLDIQSSPQYVTNGNILCAATGELVEEIGKGTVYVGNAPCIAGGDIIIIRHKQNPVFLNYVLNSSYAQAQKSCKKTKLKVVHISASDIGDVLIALPSVEEQQEIALYLDQKCSEIDSLIASKEKFITELESYKKSLIYEYVTGKKEVPAEA